VSKQHLYWNNTCVSEMIFIPSVPPSHCICWWVESRHSTVTPWPVGIWGEKKACQKDWSKLSCVNASGLNYEVDMEKIFIFRQCLALQAAW